MGIYTLAQNNDPIYQQALATTLANFESKKQARALLLPDVTLSANTLSNKQTNKGVFIQQQSNETIQFNSHGYSLNIVQPLFRWDRYLNLKQADAVLTQTESEQLLAQQDLIIRVAENYFNILTAMENLKLAQAVKKSLTKQLEQTQQQFNVGLVAITDLHEAQAGFDIAVADEILNKNLLDNAHIDMREITNEYITKISGLADNLALTYPQPNDIEQWSKMAETQNINVIIAKKKLEIAAKEIEKQQAKHLPAVDLVANHGRQASGGRFGTNKAQTSSIGLELNINLFQGGLVSAEVNQARHLYNLAFHELTQSLRASRKEARQAYLRILSGISRVHALKQSVISSVAALDATKIGAEIGTRTTVDVVRSERVALDAKSEYARSKYIYLLDGLHLKKASGSLNINDLVQVNQILAKDI
ncbi:Type I secretion outer membrane protein, TolC precursor [uncultured Candidatus Thioglobus sp.]|nr:Type I secretion outer membrane protein, TolC precursor [uncultured Candidatus Thioglobus sp.]